MKTLITSVYLFLYLFLSTASAQAMTLVDTGPGPDDNQFQNSQAILFAKFHLDHDSALTDLEGWFTTRTVSTIYLSILRDGGETPNVIGDNNSFTFDKIFEQSFNIPEGDQPDWFGVHDVAWALAAGNYWIGFTLDENVGMPGPSQNPLIDEAQFGFSNLPVLIIDFSENDQLDIGVRIQGVETVIPEPASILLFASGLAGAYLKKNRFAS